MEQTIKKPKKEVMFEDLYKGKDPHSGDYIKEPKVHYIPRRSSNTTRARKLFIK